MLTTIENIRMIRDIASNLRDARIEPYIQEVILSRTAQSDCVFRICKTAAQ